MSGPSRAWGSYDPPDPIEAEIRAAIARRKGLRPDRDTPDPKAVERRRKLEEIEEQRRIREQTEWL